MPFWQSILISIAEWSISGIVKWFEKSDDQSKAAKIAVLNAAILVIHRNKAFEEQLATIKIKPGATNDELLSRLSKEFHPTSDISSSSRRKAITTVSDDTDTERLRPTDTLCTGGTRDAKSDYKTTEVFGK
jgi:hypothetical protein